MCAGVNDPETEIVRRLKRSPRYVTADELVEASGKSRRMLPGLIEGLRSRGYRIDEVPGEGFRLVTSPDLLTASEIGAELGGGLLGSRIHVHAAVGSTNDEAFDLARDGAAEGTLVIADAQTGGRGRLGRKWDSPGGMGLWFSLVLRPDVDARKSCLISLVGALGVASALRDVYGVGAEVKWPNDVVVGSRKICGILAESELRGGRTSFIVMGVGVNVLQGPEDFGPALAKTATSLRLETGREVRRARVLADLLLALEEKYRQYRTRGFGEARKQLLALSPLIGKSIGVRTGRKEVEGTALDIDEDGALILRTDSGHLLTIVAGDVVRSGGA
jgi:BirA family biotin operon repressor/biotin-[acetyl-CoA-carboxylase] ligase